MSTKREQFCQEMQNLYPPAADIPFNTELMADDIPTETLELVDHRNEAPVPLWAWNPVWAMRKYRNLRQAQTAFEHTPPEQHQELIPFPLGDHLGYLDIDGPGEIHGYIHDYKQSFAHLTTHDPRHAAVLAATFATNKHWENREFAAQVLPDLYEAAPELTEALLTILKNDHQRKEEVGSAATASLAKLGITNPDYALPPEKPAAPSEHEVRFLSFGHLFDVCLDIEVDGNRYDDLRIEGAFRTAINHGRIMNREEEFVHAQILDPYPRVRYAYTDTGDTLIDIQGIYDRLYESRQAFNAWWPSGQRLNQEMFHSLFQTIQLLSRAANIILDPEKPLPLHPSIEEPEDPEPPQSNVKLPPAAAEHAERTAEQLADMVQKLQTQQNL